MRQLLVDILRGAAFEVSEAATGGQGLDVATKIRPDVVTLDLTLPDMDGIEVCRRLRATSSAYVIMLTGRMGEKDRVIGLEVGADDYMTKPFFPRELRARVAAMFRRPRGNAEPEEGSKSKITRGELIVDEESREVYLAGEPIDLTRIEFDLLMILISNPHRVWGRQDLAERIWQGDWLGSEHVIEVHIANLRRRLGDTARSSRWIRTVRGVGYRLGQ